MIKRNLTVLQCDFDGCERMWLPDSSGCGCICFACRGHICVEHALTFSVSTFIGHHINPTREKFSEILYLHACEKCIEVVKHMLFSDNEAKELLSDSIINTIKNKIIGKSNV